MCLTKVLELQGLERAKRISGEIGSPPDVTEDPKDFLLREYEQDEVKRMRRMILSRVSRPMVPNVRPVGMGGI